MLLFLFSSEEGLALRKCMIREARRALTCHHGTGEEEMCLGSAEAATETIAGMRRNKVFVR